MFMTACGKWGGKPIQEMWEEDPHKVRQFLREVWLPAKNLSVHRQAKRRLAAREVAALGEGPAGGAE